MAGNRLYTYSPVELTEFRLLKFVRNQDQQISAVLEAFLINQHPRFQALSYTWISDNNESTKGWNININECNLLVLDSLEPFIQALVSKGMLLDGTWWWIDFICINQTDQKERAEQIKLMRQIYLNASQVVIWLGEESYDSKLAINFIQVLHNRMEQKPTSEMLRLEFEHERYRLHWAAFKNFISRRWWSRIWTVQEFVLPSTCQFWCGTSEISRRAVCQCLRAVDKCTSIGIKETIAFRYAWNRRRAWYLYQEAAKMGELDVNFTRPLLSLAAYFCCMNATDDRDRLYGLLALATDGELLEVDYSLDTHEVYLRFAQTQIQRHESLDIICFATVHSPSQSDSPSWVPDWHRRDAFLALPVMVSQSSSVHIGNMRDIRFRRHNPLVCYSASGNRKAIYKFHGSTISVQGIVIDAVDGLAGSKTSRMVQSTLSGDSTVDQDLASNFDPAAQHSQIDILKSVCKSLVLDRHDRFLRYPAPIEEFFQDFMALCALIVVQAATTSSNVVLEFQEWYEEIKDLCIRGRSFQSILLDDIQATSCNFTGYAPNQDEYIQNSFIGRFFDTVVRMSLRLMVSRHGRIGMVPNQALKGDLVCILFGCSVPVLLRANSGDGFSFVGECFLDGFMNGAALEEQDIIGRTFLIK